MNFSVTKAAVVVLLSVGTCACSQTPTAPDRTPSWQRSQVVGTRINRRVDSAGKPTSAHTTTSVGGGEFADLPQVSVGNPRR